jgi:membrane protein
MKGTAAWELLRDTAGEWWADNAPRLGAAVAFYTMLSLAPLLVVVTAAAGFLFGEEAVRGELFHQMKDYVGADGAAMVQSLLANAHQTGSGVGATVISVVVLLVGATGIFTELQDALNVVWNVEPGKQSGGILGVIKDRLLSFLMVLLIGGLLLALVVVGAGLAAVQNLAGDLLPGGWLRVADLAVSVGMLTLLFAVLFKTLPDVEMSWKNVWIGALVTAVLFTLGKFLIGLYLGFSSVGSSYGAAGSLAVFLVWVYYSAQVFFFGAEFTQVYARYTGNQVVPRGNARPRQQRRVGATAAVPGR